MPAWAIELAQKNGTRASKEFFAASEKYERKNTNTFREFEFTLPNELSLAQKKQIVDDFVKGLDINKRPHVIAIHDKDSSISGERNPHVHIIFSDREPDQHARGDPKQYFMRYNPGHSEKGGCKKDTRFSRGSDRRKNIYVARCLAADCINRAYERAGLNLEVDPRQKSEQLQAAIERGDAQRVEQLKDLAGRHMGWKRANDHDSPERRNALLQVANKEAAQSITCQTPKLDLARIDMEIKRLINLLPIPDHHHSLESNDNEKTIEKIDEQLSKARSRLSDNPVIAGLKSWIYERQDTKVKNSPIKDPGLVKEYATYLFNQRGLGWEENRLWMIKNKKGKGWEKSLEKCQIRISDLQEKINVFDKKIKNNQLVINRYAEKSKKNNENLLKKIEQLEKAREEIVASKIVTMPRTDLTLANTNLTQKIESNELKINQLTQQVAELTERKKYIEDPDRKMQEMVIISNFAKITPAEINRRFKQLQEVRRVAQEAEKDLKGAVNWLGIKKDYYPVALSIATEAKENIKKAQKIWNQTFESLPVNSSNTLEWNNFLNSEIKKAKDNLKDAYKKIDNIKKEIDRLGHETNTLINEKKVILSTVAQNQTVKYQETYNNVLNSLQYTGTKTILDDIRIVKKLQKEGVKPNEINAIMAYSAFAPLRSDQAKVYSNNIQRICNHQKPQSNFKSFANAFSKIINDNSGVVALIAKIADDELENIDWSWLDPETAKQLSNKIREREESSGMGY